MALLSREFIAVPGRQKEPDRLQVARPEDQEVHPGDRQCRRAGPVHQHRPGRGHHGAGTAPDRRPGAAFPGHVHRRRHRRQRLPGRAVLRRHPGVPGVHLRRAHRRRPGPPDGDDRHIAGLRRLLVAGEGPGRSRSPTSWAPSTSPTTSACRGLGQRPAPQGDAYGGYDPDRAQRVADPGPLGLHARTWKRRASAPPTTSW